MPTFQSLAMGDIFTANLAGLILDDDKISTVGLLFVEVRRGEISINRDEPV